VGKRKNYKTEEKTTEAAQQEEVNMTAKDV
jgi:hypothetical protein